MTSITEDPLHVTHVLAEPRSSVGARVLLAELDELALQCFVLACSREAGYRVLNLREVLRLKESYEGQGFFFVVDDASYPEVFFQNGEPYPGLRGHERRDMER